MTQPFVSWMGIGHGGWVRYAKLGTRGRRPALTARPRSQRHHGRQNDASMGSRIKNQEPRTKNQQPLEQFTPHTPTPTPDQPQTLSIPRLFRQYQRANSPTARSPAPRATYHASPPIRPAQQWPQPLVDCGDAGYWMIVGTQDRGLTQDLAGTRDLARTRD
jgi:hypothetical protein